MKNLSKKLILVAFAALLALLFSCEDETESCFQCTTTLYEDGEENWRGGKANIYCDMDLETAYYFERVNSVEFREDGVNYKIDTRCSKLLR